MSEGIEADLELHAIDKISSGEDCPDCGATWSDPPVVDGARAANLVMVHAESCILYRESFVTDHEASVEKPQVAEDEPA